MLLFDTELSKNWKEFNYKQAEEKGTEKTVH